MLLCASFFGTKLLFLGIMLLRFAEVAAWSSRPFSIAKSTVWTCHNLLNSHLFVGIWVVSTFSHYELS